MNQYHHPSSSSTRQRNKINMAQQEIPPPISWTITFGVELEFIFAVRKSTIQSFLGRDIEQQGRDTWKYVASRLNLEDMPDEESLLGRCVADSVSNMGYESWTVKDDSSCGAFADDVAQCLQVPKNQVHPDFHWAGIELVSPVLRLEPQNVWIEMLTQIQGVLTPITEHEGALNNDSTGLHVHVAFAKQDALDLQTIKNLMILWGVCEDQTKFFHPPERLPENNKYCRSLRRFCEENGAYSHALFAWAIQECNSELAVRDLVGHDPLHTRDVQCSISFTDLYDFKPLTMEFRQHRGTQNAEEIYWWVHLCAGFVKLANFFSQIQFNLVEDPATPPHQSIYNEIQHTMFQRIGMPAEGQVFFRNKVREYYPRGYP
jgi:hypothetical protein